MEFIFCNGIGFGADVIAARYLPNLMYYDVMHDIVGKLKVPKMHRVSLRDYGDSILLSCRTSFMRYNFIN